MVFWENLNQLDLCLYLIAKIPPLIQDWADYILMFLKYERRRNIVRFFKSHHFRDVFCPLFLTLKNVITSWHWKKWKAKNIKKKKILCTYICWINVLNKLGYSCNSALWSIAIAIVMILFDVYTKISFLEHSWKYYNFSGAFITMTHPHKKSS